MGNGVKEKREAAVAEPSTLSFKKRQCNRVDAAAGNRPLLLEISKEVPQTVLSKLKQYVKGFNPRSGNLKASTSLIGSRTAHQGALQPYDRTATRLG